MLLPLFIGLTTVLLVKSITEIVWLSLLVTSLLVMIFGLAAHTMVPEDRQARSLVITPRRTHDGPRGPPGPPLRL